MLHYTRCLEPELVLRSVMASWKIVGRGGEAGPLRHLALRGARKVGPGLGLWAVGWVDPPLDVLEQAPLGLGLAAACEIGVEHGVEDMVLAQGANADGSVALSGSP